MSVVKSLLARVVVRKFAASGVSGAAHGLGGLLRELYTNFNGGYFWGGALLIRPVQPIGDAPLSVAEWNEPSLWKKEYDDVCAEVTFFAEDVFGVQFGVHEEKIVQFDPETAGIVSVAETVDGWCRELLKEPDFYTGFPVLAAWEKENHTIQAGYRLVPRQLFMLGGEFHSDNMICRPEVEGMRIRGQYWKLTKDLPDGASIKFKVVD